MDIATIFYVLGIIFFVTFILLFAGIGIFLYRLYAQIMHLKQQAPEKFMSFLRGQNSAGIKALGVSIVGLAIAAIKNKLTSRGQTL